ncbi:MAG: hypothetical protein AB1742_05990 [bacterium]
MTGKQNGSVIVMTVFIILFGAMLFFALGLLHRSELEIVTNQIRDLQALYCAEAGVERAYYQIRLFTGWPPGINAPPGIDYSWPGEGVEPDCNQNKPIFDSGATYSTNITEDYIDPNYNAFRNLVIVRSTGRSRGFTRRVEAYIRRARWRSDVGNFYYSQVLSWRDM